MSNNRGIFVTLMISLAVNLLIVGGVIGLGIANRHKPPLVRDGPPPPAAIGLRAFNGPRFFRALPQQDRRKARRLMTKNASKYRQLSRQSKQIKRDLLDLLRADTLNRKALALALEKMRVTEAKQSKLGQEIVLEVISDLDAKTRRHVVDEMLRSPKRPLARRPAQPAE